MLRDDIVQKLKKDIFNKAEAIPDVELTWEEKPVSPEEFVMSPDFYGDEKENRVWPAVLEDMNEIFSGTDYEPKYNTVVNLSGIGSGKSTFSAFIFNYLTYRLLCLRSPYKHFGMVEGTLAFMNLAPSATKARSIIFDKVVKAVERTAWFRDKGYLPDSHIRSELRFPKNINVVPGNSSKNFPLGADVYGGVIDEATFFLNQMEDPCKELYYSLDERRRSRFGNRGLILLISSANVETAFVEELMEESQTDKSIYAVRRAQWQAKPPRTYNPPLSEEYFPYTVTHEKPGGKIENKEIQIPVEFKERLERNPRRFLRDICAIPSLVIEPYFEDWDKVLTCVNKDRVDPAPDLGRNEPETPLELYKRLPDSFFGVSGTEYVCHVDLGTGKFGCCPCGIAIGHRGPDKKIFERDMPTGVLDLVARFKAPKGKEVSFSEVREFLWMLSRSRQFNFKRITFDGWNSLDSLATLRSLGFQCDISGADLGCYETMKTMIYDGRLNMYRNEVLMYELKRLELKGNRVEHALLSTKDEADCVARVCYMVTEKIAQQLEEGKLKKRARMGTLTQGLANPSAGQVPDSYLRQVRGKIF
jgi:hypothetical protein